MVSMQVRQSEGSGFKSRSGQIAYFHGVKTRFSTLGTGETVVMFLVVRTPRKTVGPVSDKIWGTQKNDCRGWNRHYRCISGIRLDYSGN